jgi:hypothetical protein
MKINHSQKGAGRAGALAFFVKGFEQRRSDELSA